MATNERGAMKGRAVLLVNLGSPDAPEEGAVRRYLDEFLMDGYVIQLPWLLRRMLVSLFVLPSRPAASALAYKSIWWDDGSPLVSITRRIQETLQARLDMPVAMAMRYGSPDIESQLLELAAKPEIHEVLFIPMYPHYADSTITTSVEAARRVIRQHSLNIELTIQPPFYDRPDYIEALVDSARSWLEQEFDHILFSYHGLPESHLRKTDPTGQHCLQETDCCNRPSAAHATCYRHQIYQTTRCFVEQTGIRDDQYTLAFQSRLGRAKWLSPATEETIRELAGKGVKRLLVLCPAFVTDCLETLEEIGIRGSEVFVEAGGESLELIPCLNDNQAWINVLANWCQNTE
jgi:ferrochelatase